VWINSALLFAELPILESSVLNTIDLDKDSVGEIVYKVDIAHIGGREKYLLVGHSAEPLANSRILRASKSIIPFDTTQSNGAGNPDFQFQGSSSGGTWVDVPLDEGAEPLRYFRMRQP